MNYRAGVRIMTAALLILLVVFAVHGQKSGDRIDSEKYTIKPHHQRLHFECRHCHGSGPEDTYAALDTSDCLSCHVSHEVVADRTAGLGYYDNIHAAPHYPEMECGLCHQEHGLKTRNYCGIYERPCNSENYCVMCHSQNTMLELKVP